MDLDAAQANLRYLLNEWDPIGIAELAPGEYHCLIAPLITRLMRGGGRSEIGEFLRHEIEDHFGPDPASYDTDIMSNRLITWWLAVDGN